VAHAGSLQAFSYKSSALAFKAVAEVQVEVEARRSYFPFATV